MLITLMTILLAQAPPNLGIPAPDTGVQGAPVTVNDCAFLYRTNAFGMWVHRLKIEFSNESSKTADLVTFTVTSDIGSATIRDVGSYSPGSEVSHEYRQFYGARMSSSDEELHCSIQAVHFTDGTTWQNGASPASSVDIDSPLGLVLESRESGVYVKFVVPGSASEAAGIRQDDRIVSIGANNVGSVSDVKTILGLTPPLTPIRLVLDRSGQTINIIVKPSQQNTSSPGP